MVYPSGPVTWKIRELEKEKKEKKILSSVAVSSCHISQEFSQWHILSLPLPAAKSHAQGGQTPNGPAGKGVSE